MSEPKWIMICGGPRTGKSTLARKMAKELGATGLLLTDDFLSIKDRGERIESIASSLKREFAYGRLTIIEGCEAPRLLDRLALFNLPHPHRVVWVGPVLVSQYEPKYRALVATQINKISGAMDIDLLKEFNAFTYEGNLVYVPSYNPRSD